MEPNYREKTLTKTDIKRLMVSSDWLHYLLPNPGPHAGPIRLLFRDELGMEYTFKLKVRSFNLNRKGYHKKPEFMYGGWHAFVQEKRLQIGDRIFIWKDGHGGLRITAHHPPSPRLIIPY